MSAVLSSEYAPPPMTGEELYALGDAQRAELEDGEMRIMTPAGFLHGRVETRIARLLGDFVERQGLGDVYGGDVGIYTRRNPDSVRGADVLYISHARLQQVRSDSYLDVAPELVVEVLSPHDRWLDVERKLEEYFTIGVDSVWIADPSSKTLRIYSALTRFQILQQGDWVRDQAILPGFECGVGELFGG